MKEMLIDPKGEAPVGTVVLVVPELYLKTDLGWFVIVIGNASNDFNKFKIGFTIRSVPAELHSEFDEWFCKNGYWQQTWEDSDNALCAVMDIVDRWQNDRYTKVII